MSALAWHDLARDILSRPDDYIDERDRRRLGAFARRVFPGYESDAGIEAFVGELEAAAITPGSRTLIDRPPRHSKSLHVSEMLPAWYLGKFADRRVIAASHSAHLAYTFSRRVRNLIVDPRYPFPGVTVAGDKAAVSAWDVEGTRGGYAAVGVGGSPTGIGANLIIIDDPIRNAADADSRTMRDALWEWYQGTIRTRLEPGGSIVVTATRWSDDDLIGRLLAAEKTGGETWAHLHSPAIDDDGHALWPERWPVPELLKIKDAVGSRVWQSQYQGDPQPAEGGTFKRQWWRPYRTLPADVTRAEITVDSAFKDGVANDFSVFALWARDTVGNAYLVRVWRARVQFPELIQMGKQAHAYASARFPTLRVPLVVEDNASGQSAIQVWQRETGIPVVPYKPVGSKISRAEAITPVVEGGRAFVPEPDADNAGWLDDWLTEHDRFPTGSHDDAVDTSTMALSRLTAAPALDPTFDYAAAFAAGIT